MKKFSITLLLLSFTTLFSQGNTVCQCGSLETGMTKYQVIGVGVGCCTGAVVGNIGHQFTYSLDRDGVYVVSGVKEVTGSVAQGDCCRSNS